MRLHYYLLFALTLAAGCGLLASEGAQNALKVIAPHAVDAITQLVQDRWGAGAEVDTTTTTCVVAPPSAPDWFGDDEGEYVYALCRGKAL